MSRDGEIATVLEAVERLFETVALALPENWAESVRHATSAASVMAAKVEEQMSYKGMCGALDLKMLHLFFLIGSIICLCFPSRFGARFSLLVKEAALAQALYRIIWTVDAVHAKLKI
jgi:hypothetical protein